jgi:hypothetical protein
LLDEGARLDGLAAHCRDCPANLFDEAFGCWGYVSYPITQTGEAWMMARVPAATTLAGSLLLKAIRDFGYDGAKFAKYRAQNLCELKHPIVKVVKKGTLFDTKLSSDQIFDTIFTAGNTLDPSHCVMVLFWLGALEVDGMVPSDASDADDVAKMVRLLRASTPDERSAVCTLNCGEQSTDPGIHAMQKLLAALHRTWVLDVPLLIDS